MNFIHRIEEENQDVKLLLIIIGIFAKMRQFKSSKSFQEVAMKIE